MSADMKQYCAAARWRRGTLMGEAQGSSLLTEAEKSMKSEGVRNIARMLHVLAPGDWTSVASDRELAAGV